MAEAKRNRTLEERIWDYVESELPGVKRPAKKLSFRWGYGDYNWVEFPPVIRRRTVYQIQVENV